MEQLTERELEAKKLIAKEINNVLDVIEVHFKKYCNEVAPLYNGGKKSTSVPIIYIEQSIKIFKENFNKGLNGEHKEGN